MNSSVAAQWAMLDHAKLVDRFRHADAEAVVRMWLSGMNEHGECLSQFERDALVERHFELFGTWPDYCNLTRDTSEFLRRLPVCA